MKIGILERLDFLQVIMVGFFDGGYARNKTGTNYALQSKNL